MANEFFGKFAEIVGTGAEPTTEGTAVETAPAAAGIETSDKPDGKKGLPPMVWVAAVIVILIVAMLVFQN